MRPKVSHRYNTDGRLATDQDEVGSGAVELITLQNRDVGREEIELESRTPVRGELDEDLLVHIDAVMGLFRGVGAVQGYEGGVLDQAGQRGPYPTLILGRTHGDILPHGSAPKSDRGWPADPATLAGVAKNRKRRNVGAPNRQARIRALSYFGTHRKGECGLCGANTKRSKTHLPPQCSGNTGEVHRHRLSSPPGPKVARLGPGRKDCGGIWVYGLCEPCNGVASKYDGSYASLSDAVRPIAKSCSHLTLPAGWRWTPPREIEVRPGSIARSVLISMFGFNPVLRNVHPELTRSLHLKEAAELPPALQLRLALTAGQKARVCGPHTGMYLLTSAGNLNRPSAASVHFPPLAWELAYTGDTDLLDNQGWADISHWLKEPWDEGRTLANVCTPLPIVPLPDRHPRYGGHWSWLFHDEICPIVECDDAYAEIDDT